MSDLKPCPFCGGEATHDTDGSAIWVICKKCGARCAGSFFSGKKGVQIVNEKWNRRALEEQQILVLSPDLTDKQVRDLFDKLRSIQPKVIGSHLTDVDLMELRDRFGKDVADVVADMISGEEKRWHKQGDGNLRTLNMKCKNCSHCTTHYYHGQDVYTYYCELAKGFTEENSYCADWWKK